MEIEHVSIAKLEPVGEAAVVTRGDVWRLGDHLEDVRRAYHEGNDNHLPAAVAHVRGTMFILWTISTFVRIVSIPGSNDAIREQIELARKCHLLGRMGRPAGTARQADPPRTAGRT